MNTEHVLIFADRLAHVVLSGLVRQLSWLPVRDSLNLRQNAPAPHALAYFVPYLVTYQVHELHGLGVCVPCISSSSSGTAPLKRSSAGVISKIATTLVRS